MHKLGMVHRDLKLENILINDTDGSNIVKIIDFGFATNCKMGSKLSAYCGTPCYMDPDLTKKRKYSGQGADVWAMGVILFLLITGGVPFWGETEQQLFSRIQIGKYNLPNHGANFSQKVKNLFDKIFVPNVANRISAEQILNDPWITGSSKAPPKSAKKPKLP